MIYPSADKLENWGNKYALATLAAKRAKQIKSGAPAMIDTDSRNPLTIALEEIAAGKISCEVPDVDVVATLAVEPEAAQLLSLTDDFDQEAEELAADAAPVHEDETSYEDEEEEEEEEEHEVWPIGFEEDEEEAEDESATPVDEEEGAVAAPVDVADDIEAIPEADDEEASSEDEESEEQA